MEFGELELAFEFVSSAPEYANSAYINKTTGQTYLCLDDGEPDELPDDVDENEDYIAIPHKNELDLGRDLVFEFVGRHLPSESDRVADFFGSRGAYARLKDLLHQHGLLEEWYRFDNERQRAALLEWCEDNGIVIEPEETGNTED